MTTAEILLLAPALVLGVFGAHQWLLLLLSVVALARGDSLASARAAGQKRFVILVPAHDEELLIGQTVDSILAARYPRDRFDLFVIADNCSDKTAEIVRAHGAGCLERFDTERRGKPYALDWAIRQLDLNRYDALVIIDADTAIHPDFLTEMETQLGRGRVALQGYFGVLNPDQNWLTRLSLAPGILKFKLHFPGKDLVKLSCPLAGNGMCFDISIIKRFGWNAFSLTENWEYWVLLTLADVRVDPAPKAIIYSQVAKSLSSGTSQRMRWMKGRIETLRAYGGTLIKRGVLDADMAKVEAVLELAKPSHAVYLAWAIGYFTIALAAWFYDRTFSTVLVVAAVLLAAQVVYLLIGFAMSKPPLRTWLALFMVPWYILWKLMVSIKGLSSMGDRAWVRTKRH